MSDDDGEAEEGVGAKTPENSGTDESEVSDTDEREPGTSEKSTETEGEPGTSEKSIEIEGGGHLKEVVFGHDIVLANCYAEWCDHCQSMLPVVEELAADHDMVLANIDVEQNRAIAGKLVNDSLPRFVLFVDQKQMARLEGEQDRKTFEQLLGRVEEFREQL
jgi:thioredoxin 1